ncbi:MAG: hypothetical protein R6U92_02145 [Bacillota bacterium]
MKIPDTWAKVTALVACAALVALMNPWPVFAQDIIGDDCAINETIFEREWRKYSDFDDLIPPESRSWDVQQHAALKREVDELQRKSLMLQAEMEFDRQMRLELRDVKRSLVNNLRNNLVKSFFRLSFLTADAIKTGTDLGKTYAKLFTAGVLHALPEGLSYLKDAMDVVTGLTPDHGDSELAKEVATASGDIADIIKIADNPKNIANVAAARVKSQAEERLGQIFPSIDDMKFSEAEVDILRTQNLRNRAIDDALMESYRVNSERREQVTDIIPAEIARLEAEMEKWELSEKARVRDMLIADCKGQREEDEPGDEDSRDTSGEARTPESTGGDPAEVTPGLEGSWSGTSTVLEVYPAAGLNEEERAEAVGGVLSESVEIVRDESGALVIRGDDVETILTVDGTNLTYYIESLNPFDDIVYYEKMEGIIEEEGTVITGTVESGSLSEGPMALMSLRVVKVGP